MNKLTLAGIGVLIGYYLANYDKAKSIQNGELIIKMITRGASMEELKTASELISKYCMEGK